MLPFQRVGQRRSSQMCNSLYLPSSMLKFECFFLIHMRSLIHLTFKSLYLSTNFALSQSMTWFSQITQSFMADFHHSHSEAFQLMLSLVNVSPTVSTVKFRTVLHYPDQQRCLCYPHIPSSIPIAVYAVQSFLSFGPTSSFQRVE